MLGSDIYIMCPVTGTLDKKKIKHLKDLDLYCDFMHETSMYECEKSFANTITRSPLGKVKISYMSDEYDNASVEWIDALCVLTYQEKSELGILVFIVPLCSRDDTQIGDIVFSGHLRIDDSEKIYDLNSYIRTLKLLSCGKEKIIYTNSLALKSVEQIGYLLAGETAGSEHIDYRIRDQKLEELSSNNIAMYDFYELYASTNSIVYLVNGFSDNYLNNLEIEALLIYICEIAVLQNAAIGRINGQIVDELMQNSNISTSKTLKLQVEFGKTILLWDNKIYNYYMSQQLSNSIVSAFETDKLLEEYERNSEHIEQIASLKSAISADIEGKVLNILAFAISIGELVQLIKQLVAYYQGHTYALGASGISVAILLLLALIIKRNRKNRNKGI